MTTLGSEQPAGQHGHKKSLPESAKVGKLLAHAFDSVGNTSQLGGLETSKWASSTASSSAAAAAAEMQGNKKPDLGLMMDGASGDATPTQRSVAPDTEATKVADVDDAAAFMAAVHSRVDSKSVSKSAKEPKKADDTVARRGVVESEGKKGKQSLRPSQRSPASPNTTAIIPPLSIHLFSSLAFSHFLSFLSTVSLLPSRLYFRNPSHRQKRRLQFCLDESDTRITPLTKDPTSENMGQAVDGGLSAEAKAADADAAANIPPVRIAAEETRWHQLYFENWGSPMPRDAPGKCSLYCVSFFKMMSASTLT